MENDVAEILIPADRIAQRTGELGAAMTRDFAGKPLTIVIISSGALMFAADLVRQIPLPLELDVLSVKSYIGTRSSRRVTVLSELHVSLRDRHVVVVDDIFDSGLTLATVVEALSRQGPAEVRTCVLLQKERARDTALAPDYVGFPIPDLFVVGYGLDYKHKFRHLPFICTFKEEYVPVD